MQSTEKESDLTDVMRKMDELRDEYQQSSKLIQV